MRPVRLLWALFWVVLAAAAVQWLVVPPPGRRQELPWTPLDLRDPVGLFTGAKLGALAGQPGRCRALLRAAGIGFTPLPPRPEPDCGWTDAVRLRSNARAPRPREPLACPLAAGLHLWMEEVVAPAAADLLHARIVAVIDYGSFSCRHIENSSRWSEHAFANAIDIAGFRLGDGRRITVAADWTGGTAGRFLHRVRDGGCRLFGTTLSPDYNRAHRDHLHLDMAARGWMGPGFCR